jgi:hypothetical protein
VELVYFPLDLALDLLVLAQISQLFHQIHGFQIGN